MIRSFAAAALVLLCCPPLYAQRATAPGFIEARGLLFPQTTPNDDTRAVSDWLWRQEGILRPAPGVQLAAGVDLRANTHDQVEDVWRIDWEDRHLRPPRLSVRRLALTLTGRGLTLDLGKQLVRWARADVLNPIDRFAPRDFTHVIDTEFLPVIGARASWQIGPETFEAVWVPHFTPSRMPLLTQRWAPLAATRSIAAAAPPADDESAPVGPLTVVDAGSRFPHRAQAGGRWRHTGGRLETGLSFMDGYNHLPGIDIRALDAPAGIFELTRVFPRIRTYGADFAFPTGLVTLKGEAVYITSPGRSSDDYGLYVMELERQVGEWLLTGGYAGEVVKQESRRLAFDPERALARSIILRAAYTVDPRRTITVEAVGRQNGDGYYLNAEYSQAVGEFWRVTLSQIVLAGDEDDFLGQYQRNSHFIAALRLSF